MVLTCRVLAQCTIKTCTVIVVKNIKTLKKKRGKNSHNHSNIYIYKLENNEGSTDIHNFGNKSLIKKFFK